MGGRRQRIFNFTFRGPQCHNQKYVVQFSYMGDKTSCGQYAQTICTTSEQQPKGNTDTVTQQGHRKEDQTRVKIKIMRQSTTIWKSTTRQSIIRQSMTNGGELWYTKNS